MFEKKNYLYKNWLTIAIKRVLFGKYIFVYFVYVADWPEWAMRT